MFEAVRSPVTIFPPEMTVVPSFVLSRLPLAIRSALRVPV
jgi:hypothetical protein